MTLLLIILGQLSRVFPVLRFLSIGQHQIPLVLFSITLTNLLLFTDAQVVGTKARLAGLAESARTLQLTVNETLVAMAAAQNAMGVEGMGLGTRFLEKHHEVYLDRAEDNAKIAVAMLQVYKERLGHMARAHGVHSLEQDAGAHGSNQTSTGGQ